MQGTLGVFPAMSCSRKDLGSRNMWGLTTTNRVQRKEEAVWVTSKVLRAFSKEPPSHRSSDTTQADRRSVDKLFMEPNTIKGTSFSPGYVYQLFPCNDNGRQESPKNSVLSRKGEVGAREPEFGFVYSSNFLS